jgi:hypothetical protein
VNLGVGIKPGLPILDPLDACQYTPSRHPLILRFAFFPPGAVFAPAWRSYALPEKSNTGKSCLASAFHKHLADPHLLAA